jgi:hypothetical protein
VGEVRTNPLRLARKDPREATPAPRDHICRQVSIYLAKLCSILEEIGLDRHGDPIKKKKKDRKDKSKTREKDEKVDGKSKE